MTAILMERQIEHLASELDAAGVTSPGQRYPEALRQRSGQLCAALRAHGWTWSELSEVLDVTERTLKRWVATSTTTPPVLRQVDLVEDRGIVSALAIVSPSGWRVEGITLDDLAELLG